MIRFALKLILFTLPLLCILCFPLYIFVIGKEYVTAEAMLERVAAGSDRFRYGLAYSDPAKPYKLQMTLASAPEVLALGTSRTAQTRSLFFKPGVRFYNASLVVGRIHHFRLFLDRLPRGQEPKVIIAGLDQNFFNPNWDRGINDNYEALLTTGLTPLAVFFGHWTKLYHDYFTGKFTLAQLHAGSHPQPGEIELIGLQAMVKRQGFRSDGSYDTRHMALYPEDEYTQGFPMTIHAVTHGLSRFVYAQQVSAPALREVQLFLTAARERDILVVGYLPPLSHRVYTMMRAMGNKYAYLEQLPAALKQIFAEYGQPFMDFTDLATLGASDRETLDGFHESEKANLRLMIQLAQTSHKLEGYCDIAMLQAVLTRATGDHYVFEHDF